MRAILFPESSICKNHSKRNGLRNDIFVEKMSTIEIGDTVYNALIKMIITGGKVKSVQDLNILRVISFLQFLLEHHTVDPLVRSPYDIILHKNDNEIKIIEFRILKEHITTYFNSIFYFEKIEIDLPNTRVVIKPRKEHSIRYGVTLSEIKKISEKVAMRLKEYIESISAKDNKKFILKIPVYSSFYNLFYALICDNKDMQEVTKYNVGSALSVLKKDKEIPFMALNRGAFEFKWSNDSIPSKCSAVFIVPNEVIEKHLKENTPPRNYIMDILREYGFSD